MLELLKDFKDPNVLLKYVKFIWCEFFIASAYNLFLVPNKLVTGGSGGLGIVLNAAFGIKPSTVVLIFCLFVFLLSVFFLDKEQIIPTFVVTLVFPFFIDITSGIDKLFFVSSRESLFLLTIFGALIIGFFQGCVLKIGLNFGGTSVIAMVFYKYFNISIPFTNSLINGFIVFLGIYYIGFDVVLYAIVFLIILKRVSENVMLGSSRNKNFKIITSKHKEVINFIEKRLNHDVTIYNVLSYEKNDDKKLIMSVIPTNEFVLLRDFITSIDSKAFIFISDTYNIEGQDLSIKN